MKENSNMHNYIWWLFTLVGVPITLPWIIYNFIHAVVYRRRKAMLRGKVVMITGASSGLGEALSHIFYGCGCKLILISRREHELHRVKETLLNTHQTVPTHVPIILPLDITEINRLSFEVEKIIKIHSKIDILINNAGISYRGKVSDSKVDIDIKVMLLNYFSQIALAKAVLPWMIKQNLGHIVCISSIQGKMAIPFRSAYAASKHALQAWCDSARAELYSKNIKIIVVSPGYICTALSENALTGSGQKYGVMDETTKHGYLPIYVAKEILKSVLREDKEVVIGSYTQKCAILLRTLCPSVYFWIMKHRAKEPK